MVSFQAKIGWKRQRKGENKNYISIPFPPKPVRENSKNLTKKIEKLKYTIVASFQAKIG